jgi:hypothetical protein
VVYKELKIILLEEKINRDLLTNPETQIFDLTGGGINSLRSTLEVPNFDIENQFAEVTKQDLARYNKGKGRMAETIQKTNLQDLKDMGIINPTMTEYEFNPTMTKCKKLIMKLQKILV